MSRLSPRVRSTYERAIAVSGGFGRAKVHDFPRDSGDRDRPGSHNGELCQLPTFTVPRAVWPNPKRTTTLRVAFVSLQEGIDATTPAGKLQMHILAAIAEFERARIAERVKAGLARARKQGKKLGRPEKTVSEALIAPVRGLSVRQAAKQLGVSPATAYRWMFQKTSRNRED